jgi:hypothetical protein
MIMQNVSISAKVSLDWWSVIVALAAVTLIKLGVVSHIAW